MTDHKVEARLVGAGPALGQLVSHPRLPLLAGLEQERPTLHVWELRAGTLHELTVIGAGAEAYDSTAAHPREPLSVSWHPTDPLLLIADLEGRGGLQSWTPDGLIRVVGASAKAPYQWVACGSDGRTVWASPVAAGAAVADEAVAVEAVAVEATVDEAGNVDWSRSEVIDLTSGTMQAAPPWDTGLVFHPGGGLAVTMSSDQAETTVIFVRVDQSGVPATLRVLSKVLVLDVDLHEAPVISGDGHFIAFRGNAYAHIVQIYEFPSLRRVAAIALREFPRADVTKEQLDEFDSWSRHNLAFAPGSGRLLVGTPAGTLVEIDVETRQAVEHDVLDHRPVGAVSIITGGELLVACGTGELFLVNGFEDDDPAATRKTEGATERVSSFLAEVPEVTDRDATYRDLPVTDGTTVWVDGDCEIITFEWPDHPSWLQLRAMIGPTFSS